MVAHNTEDTLIIRSSNPTPWNLPKEAEHFHPQESLHKEVSALSHRRQNLGAIKVSFSRRMNRSTDPQMTECYSALKRMSPEARCSTDTPRTHPAKRGKLPTEAQALCGSTFCLVTPHSWL